MSDTELLSEIRELVAVHAGVPLSAVSPQTRVWEDLKLYGDDVAELIAAFGKRFNVDVSGYRWYHHTGPEGCSPLWLLRKPWWARKTQIPIAVRDLVESARRGRWSIRYPEDGREA